MPKYEMVIHVESADDMALIVQACKGSAELIHSHKIDEPAVKKKRRARRAPMVRTGVIRGEDLIRNIFSDGKHHTSEEMKKTFAKNSFSPNSYSPSLARLHNGGEVKRVAEGEWAGTSKLKTPPANSGGH